MLDQQHRTIESATGLRDTRESVRTVTSMSEPRTQPSQRASLFQALFPSKRRRVLLLTGGGTRGAAQVGMLKALVNAGWEFDAVVGCSVGSLNAISFASDPGRESIDDLERLWRSLRTKDIFPVSPMAFIRGLAHQPNVFGDAGLRKMINGHLRIDDLDQAKLPLAVMTTELLSGRSVAWRSGPAVDILAASSALPGAYPPVRLGDGKLHIDGGVASSIPVRTALELFEATEIWVLDVLGRPAQEEHRTARDVINTAFSHSSNVVAESELALLRDRRRVRVHHLQLPLELRALDASSFSHTSELINAGEQSARKYLETF